MIDTHAHINTDKFSDDIGDVILRAKENGIEKIIIPAIEPKEFDSVVELVDKFDNLYFGIGIHPHNSNELNDESFERIKAISKHEKCVAIGEIGLDYYYDFVPKDVQKEAFRKQIRLAKELNLPIIVHNRESDEDLLNIIAEEQDGSLRGVLHCFSSSVDVMNRAIDLKMNVSFTGNITFKKTDLDEQVRLVPLDRVMIETDSPYMAPVPYRGKRNEPAYVSKVAEKISEIKSISLEEIKLMTTKNAVELFKLSMFLLAFFALSNPISAQTKEVESVNLRMDQEEEEEELEEEEYYEYEEDEFESDYAEEKEEEELEEELAFKSKYKKTFGFGPVFGPNTIVRNIDRPLIENDPDESSEGVPAYGGSVAYSPFDFLILQASFLYTKDNKPVEDHQRNGYGGTVEPNIHQTIEFTSLWVANPHNKISVYGSIGATYFSNSLNGEKNSNIGINGGIGLYLNLPLGDGNGLLAIHGEWRVDFALNDETIVVNEPIPGESTSQNISYQSTAFFSIPRVMVLWYPEF